MRTPAPALLIAAALLTGCNGGAEPSAPPSSEDALTTSSPAPAPTTDTAPTTGAPGDDVELTTAPGDAVETTEAGGPPVLPEEAQEDSESGAEAFALHYLDLLNYAATTPAQGLIDPLASDECETCGGFQEMINTYVSNDERAAGPILQIEGSRAISNGLTTTVFLDSVQTVPATLDAAGDVATASGDPTDFTMVMTVTREAEGWTVSAIQVQQ